MDQKDWEVLDACLNADDLRPVVSAYTCLKNRGLLRTFEKYGSIGDFPLLVNEFPFNLYENYLQRSFSYCTGKPN